MARWLIPLIILLVIFVTFATYQWVIPRADLEVRSVYHESPGGGGTGGAINYNVLITNWGNRRVEDLNCAVRIFNSSGGEVAMDSITDVSLYRRDNVEMALHFVGDQFSDFEIRIHLFFDCKGNSYVEDLDYYTKEDQMNIVFVDHIG